MSEVILTENLKILKDVELEDNYHILIVEQIINDCPYYLVSKFYNNDPISLDIFERIDMILTEKFCDEKFIRDYSDAENEFYRMLNEYNNDDDDYEEEQ